MDIGGDKSLQGRGGRTQSHDNCWEYLASSWK